ncbi:hypothetical protein CEXT_751311 [Caerostris extrusa]|uniref:Uncharacterized protein n=1 Tax=Caerostris extrusa TaxID=172846 RepID=A0AAV4W309_CAEEX|nr:hypothetical protein CEXT_751311 [Caerostris extrusa]
MKWISDLEEELLQITFDLPLRHVSIKYESENIIQVPASIISSAWEKILNFSLKSVLNAPVSAANQNLNLSHNKKNKYSFDDDDDDDDSDIEMECLDSVPDSEEVAFSMETESISADFQEQLHCLEILGDYCGLISSETHIKKSDSFPEIMIKKLLSVISIKAQNLNDVHLHVIKKDTNLSEQIMQNKSHMLHLIRILSKKELDKKGSSVTSYFIAKIY